MEAHHVTDDEPYGVECDVIDACMANNLPSYLCNKKLAERSSVSVAVTRSRRVGPRKIWTSLILNDVMLEVLSMYFPGQRRKKEARMIT